MITVMSILVIALVVCLWNLGILREDCECKENFKKYYETHKKEHKARCDKWRKEHKKEYYAWLKGYNKKRQTYTIGQTRKGCG